MQYANVFLFQTFFDNSETELLIFVFFYFAELSVELFGKQVIVSALNQRRHAKLPQVKYLLLIHLHG